MAPSSDNSYPPDICLLLRAHSEQRWLSSQVLPVLDQVEHPESIPPEQLAAAYAYLEVLWLEAGARAADTDAALADMLESRRAGGDAARAGHAASGTGERLLRWKALRYHATVRSLRSDIDVRVHAVMAVPGDRSHEQHATL
jgi:hypothetical protein